jgi:hypothetical protein
MVQQRYRHLLRYLDVNGAPSAALTRRIPLYFATVRRRPEHGKTGQEVEAITRPIG